MAGLREWFTACLLICFFVFGMHTSFSWCVSVALWKGVSQNKFTKYFLLFFDSSVRGLLLLWVFNRIQGQDDWTQGVIKEKKMRSQSCVSCPFKLVLNCLKRLFLFFFFKKSSSYTFLKPSDKVDSRYWVDIADTSSELSVTPGCHQLYCRLIPPGGSISSHLESSNHSSLSWRSKEE